MENNNQRVLTIVIVATVLILVIIFSGVTYAFFTANNPEGSTAQIISKSGRMLINYNDGTDNIIPVTNIQPSNNNILVDKTFALTESNTTSRLVMPFTISLEYQNTFKNGELFYFLKRVDDSENVVVNIVDGGGINGPITQEILEQLEQRGMGLPQDLVGYYVSPIMDWSNNPYSQEIAKGHFNANSENETITFNLKMMFLDTGHEQDYNKGATFNGKIVVTVPETSEFTMYPWEEIAANVKSGNASKYPVGSEKEVEIGGKSYTVRVANNTTPAECSGTDFSQTACGFVVEFVDVPELRQMNSTNTNVGGWEASEMRTYANGDFLNKLPEELRNVIIDTKVVSGHGSSDKNANRADGNWESIDKIYLLSAHELWSDKVTYNNGLYKTEQDTDYNVTRQLDYYAKLGVKTNNDSGTIKKNINGITSRWWLRAAISDNDYGFLFVSYASNWNYSNADDTTNGFVPAFRIG